MLDAPIVAITGSSVSASLSITASAQASCTWWDTGAKAYSSAGCIGIPSPSPPGHALFYRNLSTPSDVILPLLWDIAGPLATGCLSRLVDCGSAAPAFYPLFDPSLRASGRAHRPLPSAAALRCSLEYVMQRGGGA